MWSPPIWPVALTLVLTLGISSAESGPVLFGKDDDLMSTELTPVQDPSSQGRGRLLFGLLPGGRPSVAVNVDTTDVPVSPRVARDVQWEVARRWGVDPDRIHLEFGLASGNVPDRVASIRLLGTGTKGHWVALLSPADPTVSPSRVRLRAGVERFQPVATRNLARGEVLSDGDIGRDVTVVWGAPRSEFDDVAVGWVVRRPISAGEALTKPAVAAPDAVTSGEPIEVLWRRGAVSVSLAGVALGSGPVGAEVRVRTESGRELRGVAQSDGVVLVGGPARKER